MSIPFLLDEKPTVVPVGSAGERSGGARKVPYRAARSNSERAAPSACVGRRFSAPQIVWNRSTRRAGARGGARVGRPRWLRILMITGGSSIGGDDLQGAAAVGAVFDVDVEDPFEQPGPTHARRFSLTLGRDRSGARWHALPERERFYCATSRWAPARRGSESDVNAGAAPGPPGAP